LPIDFLVVPPADLPCMFLNSVSRIFGVTKTAEAVERQQKVQEYAKLRKKTPPCQMINGTLTRKKNRGRGQIDQDETS